jgi:formamidopyrimidine-DNA glycosylase
VVIMHLGMSGSFRIGQAAAGGEVVGDFHHERSRDAAHDHVVLTLSSGATVTYNDPRRFGFMLMTERRALAEHPFFARLGVEPTGNDLSAEAPGEDPARQGGAAEGGPARPVDHRRARQHLCLRGAASRRPVAAAGGRERW